MHTSPHPLHTLISNWLTGRQRATQRTTLLQESPLAGFEYHRAPAIWCFMQEGDPLRLVREHLNPHDPNAIAVWFKNEKLGYIPKKENATLAQLMDRGHRLEARITRLLHTDNPWRRVRVRVEMVV